MKGENNMFEKIYSLIKEHDTVVIHRHVKPDGDAVGSQTGLKYILKAAFPEKKIYSVGDNPGFFGFIEGSEIDEIPDDTYKNALAIILDCGAASLISDGRYTLAKATARIDHHIYTERFTDEEVIDTSFESCCGMITAFAVECGLEIPPVAAAALYTGIVTDSGRFRYDGTTPATHRNAAVLLEKGIDTTRIFRNLYADNFESKRLKASFVLKIKFTQNNVAYIYTTKEEFDDIGADIFTVSRGMVNTMADIKGVDIWVNFTETDSGVLCEIRSSIYNINPVATMFGGGGHAKASGATVKDRETAMQMLAELDKISGESK